MNPQTFTLVGLTHRTISAALRDAVTIEEHQRPAFLAALKAQGMDEVMALFTGGRVEIWGITNQPDAMAAIISRQLAQQGNVPEIALAGCLTVLTGQTAVAHAFYVASSLDSVVLGDPQMVPQIRLAKETAMRVGTCGASLTPVIDAALRAAERVHAETAIGEGPVSIATAAVALAQNVHGDLRRSRCLLLGDDAMGTLVAEALQQAGLSSLTITTPREEHAESLAHSLDAHSGSFGSLPDLLVNADIVVSALGDRSVTLTMPLVKDALRARRRRPIYLVDVAVPGDVDPSVNDLDNVFLYDLSDLEKLVQAGRSTREQAGRAATALVDAEVLAFCRGGGCCGAGTPSAFPAQWETLRQEVLQEHNGDAAVATRILLERIVAASAAEK